MCLYPKLIKNKKYTSNKKNGGNVPVCHDNRLLYVTAACGKCYECRKQKARAWQVRMAEEIRNNQNAIFVTLTINEENYNKLKIQANTEIENEVATKAIRLFLERIRKETKKSIKHWFITERGHEGTKRVHLHGIMWGINAREMCKKWSYGFVFIGDYVTEQTITYIVKYMTKVDIDNKNFQGKVLCSKGIGENYINRQDSKNNKFKENNTNETYRLKNGAKINLPIYYRNKLYTEDQREKLFIEKLNKGEVWVCGEKCMIDNEEEYEELLKYHRQRAIILQNDNYEEWEKEKYIKKLRKQREYYKKEKKRLYRGGDK